MNEIQRSTLGIGMEAVGMRAVHNGFYIRPTVTFVAGWVINTISRIAGGANRAS